jgi:hypothetical protein
LEKIYPGRSIGLYKDTELNKLRLAYKDLQYKLKYVVDENLGRFGETPE